METQRQHSGDRRVPSQEAGRQECALHNPPPLGLPTTPVQTGPETSQASWTAHSDKARHHFCLVAVHQDPQAPGLSRERVCQLRPLPQADLPVREDEVCRDPAEAQPSPPPTRSVH